MSKLNERLHKFYAGLVKAYPTIEVVEDFASEDSLTFVIDYKDINALSLAPIMKHAALQKLTLSKLNVVIREGQKYLIGTVQLREITIASQDPDKEEIKS
jgi:hypothetical protein